MLPRVTIVAAVLMLQVVSYAWVAQWMGLLGDVGLCFGYYGDFNIAKQAIQNVGCVDSIEYSRHEDLTLESFHFKVRTKSGRVIRVWFSDEMDVDQVCRRPMGLVIWEKRHVKPPSHVRNILALSTPLMGKSFQVRDVKDVLCNIAELEMLLDKERYDERKPTITGWEHEFQQYLHVEIADEESTTDYLYTAIQ